MIELRIYLRDGGIVTEIVFGPISGEEIAEEFRQVRNLYGEPVRLELSEVSHGKRS